MIHDLIHPILVIKYREQFMWMIGIGGTRISSLLRLHGLSYTIMYLSDTRWVSLLLHPYMLFRRIK